MTLMSTNSSPITNTKEQMLYIFKGYMNTRPGQSNIFRNILRCYRTDMLYNADNVDKQKQEITTSLTMIYTRYGYTEISIEITHNELNNEFIIEITATDRDGNIGKLSESLIFDNKEKGVIDGTKEI